MKWTVALDGGPRRVNHAAVTVADKIFSFGGYCTGEDYSEFRNIDVYILDTVILRWKVWECPNNSPVIPFQRYGHTVVAYGSAIFLWGGRNDITACNKLFCFNTGTNTWSVPVVSGMIPDARDGHSACIVKDVMYIFAGYLESTDCYTQEIHALDLRTLTWKYISTEGPKPIYRDFHTASSINGMMYVWGGREVASGWYESLNHEEYGSQLHVFNPIINQWSMIVTSGNIPVGRRSHSAVVYKNELYIFGGYNSKERKHYNDMHKFNPETNKWNKITPLGAFPCPRRRQAFCLSGTKIFLFGGTSPSSQFNEDEHFDDDDQNLIDHGDLYVLDLEPSLKTLSMLAVLEYQLDTSELPVDLKLAIKIATLPNTISRPNNHTG